MTAMAPSPAALPVPDCPGPLEAIRAPQFRAPPGSCDCHFHVFGPYDRYPLAPERGYTPPVAHLAAFRQVMARLRMERCVIVQPSIYGSDHACLLEALQQLGPEVARGVAVVDADTSDAELRHLHAAGIRGARFNLVSGGGPNLSAMRKLACRLAPLGWHLSLFLPGQTLAELATALIALPVEVVIDHLGDIDPRAGENGPAFLALQALAASGRAWIKLTGYRSSHLAFPYPDLAPYVRKLAALRPEALLWGSNWPHPIRYEAMPDDSDLLDALRSWLPDEALLQHTLVLNPAKLYGFEA
jgi:predicted TIM-barrel fold metal-dependent hydrolase